MRQGIRLLDKALDIAHQEMTALEDGDYRRAEKLAEKRGGIIDEAWNLLEDDATDQYRSRLVSLSQMQECLTSMANGARSVIVDSLRKSRLERRRMHGYRQSVGHAFQ
ncbi:MAG: hypothetical protein LBB60_11295 [Desulfovibrio sp.]|jgi:hypothetical protein|nr:hypothetical protein [Desulfovibrio sp.]